MNLGIEQGYFILTKGWLKYGQKIKFINSKTVIVLT